MADDMDDIFKPRLGRIRNQGGQRAKSYINRILHQASAAGQSGFGRAQRSRRFTGNRIGRGGDLMRQRRAGHRFGPSSRRVIIKTRIVKLKGGGINAARAHLRYVQRDGVSKEHEPGQLYDATGDAADGSSFLDRSEGDRHQFRFIVSPEDAAELADLKPFVRDLMAGMETDLGTKLDWVAVDHFNTEHPHTHIMLRGRNLSSGPAIDRNPANERGKDLVIARDYITHGMRQRASELLTLELGPQTEREILQKLERQVDQARFTDLDRGLVRDAVDGLIDARPNYAGGQDRTKQALRIGRLRALEKRGLAQEAEPGRWQLSPRLEATLRRAGERGDIIKTMHRGLRQAGLAVGVADYAIYDPGDQHAQSITGQIVDRGLHDEMKDGHFIMIDATDGHVHYVALDSRQDMEDLPMGAVIEVQPATSGLKPSDRTIAEVAWGNDGLYTAQAHHAVDPNASEAFVEAHVRRLEALRRLNVVRRYSDGSWDVPEDFVERVAALAEGRARYPGRVVTLSHLSLGAQTSAGGATWLDRQLLAKEPLSLRGDRFGVAVTEALERRTDYLVDDGLAQRTGQALRFQRNLLSVLRQRELVATGEKLGKEMGLEFAAPMDGDRFEGVYKRSVQLASGKFAVIAKSKEFTLVPWRPVLERQRGKMVGGVMRGSSVSFEFGKTRGVGRG
jgi:type IV secretory pathway VirD2 relaxase